MGKAREAWHAARVVVLQPLEQLSKFLLAFLLPQQPYLVLLLQTFPGGTEDHIHFGPSSVAHPSGRATEPPCLPQGLPPPIASFRAPAARKGKVRLGSLLTACVLLPSA